MIERTFSIPGKPFSKQSVRSRIVSPNLARVLGEMANVKVGRPMAVTPKNVLATARRLTFVTHYQSTGIKQSEDALKLIVKTQLESHWEPWDGPVLISNLILSFPLVSSLSAAQKKAALSGVMIPKYTAPDVTDNLMKGIFDAMQGLVYTNDSRIIGIQNSIKCYWKRPGTFIRMKFFESVEEYVNLHSIKANDTVKL